jgi:hypothetical protein
VVHEVTAVVWGVIILLSFLACLHIVFNINLSRPKFRLLQWFFTSCFLIYTIKADLFIYLFVFYPHTLIIAQNTLSRIIRLLANSLLERVWREDVGPNFVHISFTTPKSTNKQWSNNYICRLQNSEGSENKNWGMFRIWKVTV